MRVARPRGPLVVARHPLLLRPRADGAGHAAVGEEPAGRPAGRRGQREGRRGYPRGACSSPARRPAHDGGAVPGRVRVDRDVFHSPPEGAGRVVVGEDLVGDVQAAEMHLPRHAPQAHHVGVIADLDAQFAIVAGQEHHGEALARKLTVEPVSSRACLSSMCLFTAAMSSPSATMSVSSPKALTGSAIASSSPSRTAAMRK